MRADDPAIFDAVVIGAGFGGLGAAVALAERGARVALVESLTYPGGCASTFRRGGYRFESGATLFSGLAPGQLFGDWIARHHLDVTVDWLDPLVELRTPDLHLEVGRDRDAFLARLAALPGAPAPQIKGFFAYQRRIADTLWSVFEDPAMLPPLSASTLLRHVARIPRYAALLPLLGRPLTAVLARFGLEGFAPLRQYLDGLCQITVQCSAAEAEAPFALATMDYYWRGTGHVRGGIGNLAEALLGAVRTLGGEVRLASRVKAITPIGGGHQVDTRTGPLHARHVIANLLPADLQSLLDPGYGRVPRLAGLGAQVATGWSAVMLYLVARAPEGASPGPHHLEIVQDPGQPLTLGNHLFVSISGAADEGRAPAGHRTITVSTHVPLEAHRGLSKDAQAEYFAGIQAKMREGLARFAPEWTAGVVHAMTASPRTFQRFTGRAAGAVGGIPRRRGLGQYLTAFPRAILPGLWMVGDTVFPGQSTLATAIGGTRVAAAVAADLGLGAAALAPRRVPI